MHFVFKSLFLIILLLTGCRPFTQNNTVSDKELDDTILGALVYLDDTQVRPRTGSRSCLYDAALDGDGCESNISQIQDDILFPSPYTSVTRNRTGEWACSIYPLPHNRHNLPVPVTPIQDSTLFVSAFVTYPLFLFDAPPESPIDIMLTLSLQNIDSYYRAGGYAFWPQTDNCPGTTAVAPYNISSSSVENLATTYIENPDQPIVELLFGKKLIHQIGPWVKRVVTDKNNSCGSQALFNIPNDADDLSAAMTIKLLYAYRTNTLNLYNRNPLYQVSKFRDINRTKEDGRDNYKKANSGAFLTWLKDENIPLFSDSDHGIMPLGVNNVDAAINANTLFALTLHNLNNIDGFQKSLELVIDVINRHIWPEATLYYPQRMFFPYAVSRLWRDAGLHTIPLNNAMKILLKDLLNEQNMILSNGLPYGSFDGGEDTSRDLSTALACCALLNIGEKTAIETGQLKAYRKAIYAGIAYLIKAKQPYTIQNSETFITYPPRAYKWEDGLFFSASFTQLAHWRSNALTAAIVIEALTKYRMRYHKHRHTLIQTKKATLIPPGTKNQNWKIEFPIQ